MTEETNTNTNYSSCAYAKASDNNSNRRTNHGKKTITNRLTKCGRHQPSPPKEDNSFVSHKQSTRKYVSMRLRQALRHR